MIDMIRTPCISSGRNDLAPKTLRYHTVDELRFEEDLWHSWRYAGIRFMRVCRLRSRRLRRLFRKIAPPGVLGRMSVQFTLDDSGYSNERCIIRHKLPPYPAVRIDRQTPGEKSPLCISGTENMEAPLGPEHGEFLALVGRVFADASFLAEFDAEMDLSRKATKGFYLKTRKCVVQWEMMEWKHPPLSAEPPRWYYDCTGKRHPLMKTVAVRWKHIRGKTFRWVYGHAVLHTTGKILSASDLFEKRIKEEGGRDADYWRVDELRIVQPGEQPSPGSCTAPPRRRVSRKPRPSLGLENGQLN